MFEAGWKPYVLIFLAEDDFSYRLCRDAFRKVSMQSWFLLTFKVLVKQILGKEEVIFEIVSKSYAFIFPDEDDFS